LRLRLDTCRRVDSRAEQIGVLAKYIACVEPDAELDAIPLASARGTFERLLNASCAVDCAPRGLERNHQAVAQALDLKPSVFRDFVASECLRGGHQLPSGGISQTIRERSRPFDVCEQYGDGAFWQFLDHYAHPTA
jgi:hypothetical protein